jgi:hypothetical protein
MKKLYMLLFFTPFFSLAQSTWTSSSSGYNTSLSVNGMTIADNGDAFVSTVEFTSSPTFLYIPKLYTSTNSGAAWTEVSMSGLPTPDGSPIATCLASKGTLLLMGYNTSIYKSVNSGATWTATGYSATYTPQSIAIDGSNTIFATAVYFNSGNSTYNIKLYTSINAGANWTEVSTTGLPQSMTATITAKGTIMYIGTDSGIYKSTNAGLTWTSASNGYDTGLAVQSIVIDDNDRVLASTIQMIPDLPYEVLIYQSADGGANWTQVATTGLPESMSGVLAVKGSLLLCGVASGIYKSALILGISNGVETNHIAFYPNPANQLITVDAALKRIELHNALGKSILNQNLNGSSVDVSAIEKGLYLFQGFDGDNQLLFSEKLIIDKN